MSGIDPSVWRFCSLAIPLVTVLFIACITDIRTHRIQNKLTFSAAIYGIAANCILFGWTGLGFSLGGFGVGLAMMLPMYLSNGMGAGDVKLVAATGTFVGTTATIWSVLFTLVAGAIIAAAILVKNRQFYGTLRAIGRSIWIWLMSRTWTNVRSPDSIRAGSKFPYAVAIAAGTMTSCIWNRSELLSHLSG